MLFTAVDETFREEDVQAALQIIPDSELVGVAPYRYETVKMNDRPIMAAATDMEGAKAASPFWRVNGDWPSKSGELMIGKTVANLYKASVGDTLTVSFTPEADSTGGEEGGEVAGDTEFVFDNYIDFTVAGILDTGGNEEDYIYMSFQDLETLTGKPVGYDVCELSVSATSEKLTEYADQISGSVDALNARLVKRVTQSETTVLSKLQALVLLVTIVVLGLTMICVATTMTAVVAERRKEIGLKKALGASDQSIIGEFLGEGLMLGGAGGLLGAVLGFVFAQMVSVSVFNSSISFRPLLLPVTIVVSILVTGVACLLPIRSATDVDPALVLKGE